MNLQQVAVSFGNIRLEGSLCIPNESKGLVLFAHGSGSSRFSTRNQFVARFLNQCKIATFLTDLLTTEENKIDEETGTFRFDIKLLSQRLIQLTDWLLQNPRTKSLPIGYFGASTGAAAALIAAALKGTSIFAVVSRGGRPDLARPYLTQVQSPTLLIVGENDPDVIDLNNIAYSLLKCPKNIEIVPEATHLFEEPGCLEKVAKLSADWFLQHSPRIGMSS